MFTTCIKEIPVKEIEPIQIDDSAKMEKEEAKLFFKDVFKRYRYDLYGKFFKLNSQDYRNYLRYNELSKGEKRIVEFYLEQIGVNNERILPIEEKEGLTIGYVSPFFTPLSSDTKKNVRRKLKAIDPSLDLKLQEIAKSISEEGFQEPKHDIPLYNVDYAELRRLINQASKRDYSEEEIFTSIALIGHFQREGYLSVGKNVWGAIFRHADYKEIIEVLKDFGIITKTASAIPGWRSNQYTFNIIPTSETYNISEGKALNRIKNSKITFPKNSLKEQLKMAREKGLEGLVEDIEIRTEGYKYIEGGLDGAKLKSEFKWMQYKNMLTSFSIHFQEQIKIAQETGIYKSFWCVNNEPRINALFDSLKKMGINYSRDLS